MSDDFEPQMDKPVLRFVPRVVATGVRMDADRREDYLRASAVAVLDCQVK